MVAELLAAGAANDHGECGVLPLHLALRAHNDGVAHELLLAERALGDAHWAAKADKLAMLYRSFRLSFNPVPL